MGRDCRQQGFTLIEILIATTILAAALAVLFPALGTIQRSQHVAEGRGFALLVAQSILARMEADPMGALGRPVKESQWQGLASGLHWTAALSSPEARVGETAAWKASVEVYPAPGAAPVTLSSVVIGRAAPEAR